MIPDLMPGSRAADRRGCLGRLASLISRHGGLNITPTLPEACFPGFGLGTKGSQFTFGGDYVVKFCALRLVILPALGCLY